MTYWRRWIQREVLWHFQRWCCWCVHQTHDRHVSEPAQNSLKQQTRTSACGTTLYCFSSEYDCQHFFFTFVLCFPSPDNIMIFPFQITSTIPWKKKCLLQILLLFEPHSYFTTLQVYREFNWWAPHFFFSLSLYYNYRDRKSVNSTFLLPKNS